MLERVNYKVTDLKRSDLYHGFSVEEIIVKLNEGHPKEDIARMLGISIKQMNLFIRKNLKVTLNYTIIGEVNNE